MDSWPNALGVLDGAFHFCQYFRCVKNGHKMESGESRIQVLMSRVFV
jgi:hypothetical protein